MLEAQNRSLPAPFQSARGWTIGRKLAPPGLQQLREKCIVLSNQMIRDPIGEAMTAVMTLYRRIYFTCQSRHVVDPQSPRLLSRHQPTLSEQSPEIMPPTP